MCFSPQRRAIFWHRNFKKCSETVSILTFWLGHVLLATAACNFSTSELRECRVLYILTWKCASRHSGVQFFDIGTVKSGPELTCFAHFHFKMCFSPQRRAIFPHRNFKKWSETLSFLAFSLENVLIATAASNFSTSALQKVVRTCSVLYILTSKCASRHSSVQFLISPLTTWLRTRRFNEPTFRLTRHTNHWKNTAFRDFSNIWRGWIFFLLTFALLHLLSSDSTSSSDFTFFWLYFISLLFICFSTLHIVGSLLFKLPSITGLFFSHLEVGVKDFIHFVNWGILGLPTIDPKFLGRLLKKVMAKVMVDFKFGELFVVCHHLRYQQLSIDIPLIYSHWYTRKYVYQYIYMVIYIYIYTVYILLIILLVLYIN